MNDIVPIHDNDDDSVESDHSITEAEFYMRNINHGSDDNAVFGLSLLRVFMHDPTIKSLTLTNECVGCIERAGLDVELYRDMLTAEQAMFHESLGLEYEAYEDNLLAIGKHIARIPQLETIIFKNTSKIIEDSEFRYMFEEAMESTSLRTLLFRRCRLNHNIDEAQEVLETILDANAVENLIFEDCILDNTFMQALDMAADPDDKWTIMKFVQCSFEDEVLHKIIVQNEEDQMTETLIFHQCQSVGRNGRILNVTMEA